MPKRMGLGFLPSAETVLKKAKKPMKCAEIVSIAIDEGLLYSRGKTPEKTLYALFRRAIRHEGEACKFSNPKPGYFCLR